MKRSVSILIFCMLFFEIFSQKKQSKSLVNYKITSTRQYCGGARPPEEMLKDYATPKPYPNQHIFLKKGTTNDLNTPVFQEFITDSLGQFSAMLLPGTYFIVNSIKKNQATL